MKEYVHCSLCPPHFGWCKIGTNQIKEHNERFHKTGRMLTNDDFQNKTYF